MPGAAAPGLDTEDETPDQEDNMKENTGNESSVQNRFTAYLMSAVKHKRMNYMEKKMRIKEYENGCQDSLQKSCTDFQ